jgi:hypothetical protein
VRLAVEFQLLRQNLDHNLAPEPALESDAFALEDFTVILSHALLCSDEALVRAGSFPLSGQKIEPPERFSPLPAFVACNQIPFL